MNDILKTLMAVSPALGASLSGQPEALAAFLEGFRRTQEFLNEQRRRNDVMRIGEEDRLYDRARTDRLDAAVTAREAEAAGDRRRGRAVQELELAPRLAELGAQAETPDLAQSSIEAAIARLADPTAFGPGVLAYGQPAVEMARTAITGRQKKQMQDFVESALKTAIVADHPDVDPELSELPAHIARILGKPSARLSEVQRFADLPVGKPQGKTRVPPASGSFEEYADPTTTPERKAQIAADRKAYMQADDRPPVGTPGGLNPYQEAQFTERLAKTWTDANASQREMRRQLGLMDIGLRRFREGDRLGGSQAVLLTFQKILDPTSVVRESEYARSADGLSMIARLAGYMDRLQSGGAGVPGPELTKMVDTARAMLTEMQGHTETQRSRLEAQAKKYQIDPVLIFGVESPPPASPVIAPIRPVRRENPFTQRPPGAH